MIDAEAFVDDDGTPWLYWGSGHGWINGKCWAVQLNREMSAFVGEPRDVTPTNYFEGPIMVKRHRLYFLMYSQGVTIKDTYQVHYAVGDNPLGPFKEGPGSPILVTDKEKNVISPGHHTVFQFKGKDYILYHRHSIPFNEGFVGRQTCVDELQFLPNGSIAKVVPTHAGPALVQGRDHNRLPATASASSEAGPLITAGCVTDGNHATLWKPADSKQACWLQLDLGKSIPGFRQEIRFEYAWKPYHFTVQASEDGATWKTLEDYSTSPAIGSPVVIQSRASARFMRLVFPASRKEWTAPSVFEWSVTPATPAASVSVRPGEVWNDTAGKPINAHGGGMLFHEGAYYWYGELKEGRTYAPACNVSWGGTRVVAGGISCYRSTNLTDWENLGVVLNPVAEDPNHDLHCDKVIERPKVAYNKTIKKFVMWLHVDSIDYKAAKSGVAVSDSPSGPFQYLGGFRPNAGVWPVNVTEADKSGTPLARDFEGGQMARDMTLFVDDDNKAYHFYSSEENATMHVSLLTDDYVKPSGKYARIFIGRSMEAPAVFKREGRYYLIASDCTGWNPNPARSAVADHPLGPWTELGNPCVGKDAELTFTSQSTYVLPVQGKKDAFIFMADRWKQWDLADSRYIWLPLAFDAKGKPVITWKED
jgi:beta-xylosidase